MPHPYHNPDYLFPLIEKAGYLSAEQIEELRDKLSMVRRKVKDLVLWIDSLHLKRADDPRKILEEPEIIELIATDLGWSFKRLDPLHLDMDVVTKTFPASFAKRRLVLPFSWNEGVLDIVCYDPEDKELKDDVERACKAATRTFVSPKRDIEQIISEFFDFKRSIAAAETALHAPGVDISNLEQFVRLAAPDATASDQYIQKAVDHLLQYALDQRASDIHIEPKRKETHIRLRIDDILHTVYKLPRVIHEAICSRIKSLSRLDIAEKRRPQDGRMKLSWRGDEAEVRVSTVPVTFGEKIVLRLQSADILFSNLNKLGFSQRDLDVYTEFLKHTHGIVLITGPTGSGKSTTLYSTMRHLSSSAINIITVEDPIEMVHEDFNQIAVQPHIDVTFSTILRNILRQDPDVIMIGEIRDVETAKYAVQAALTGHLVFSTLHTNDAVSAVTRLRDLGLAPYLISSTLLGVVAQRLVRMVCKFCGKPMTVSSETLQAMDYTIDSPEIQINVGEGCSRCRQTGYWGRIGIYEVFPVSKTIKTLIHEEQDELSLKTQALKEGMKPLRNDAFRKLIQGITSLDEVIRITSA